MSTITLSPTVDEAAQSRGPACNRSRLIKCNSLAKAQLCFYSRLTIHYHYEDQARVTDELNPKKDLNLHSLAADRSSNKSHTNEEDAPRLLLGPMHFVEEFADPGF